MMWLGLFFLLRPGEYTKPASDSHPFRLADVKLWVDNAPLDIFLAPQHTLLASTFVSLTFSTQKNGTRGEVIGHGRSPTPQACPVHSVARRIIYSAGLAMPSQIHRVYWQRLSPQNLFVHPAPWLYSMKVLTDRLSN
jgi:hypothetical protein